MPIWITTRGYSHPGHSGCSLSIQLAQDSRRSAESPCHGASLAPRGTIVLGVTESLQERPIEVWLTDMDGVLVREGIPIPGAPEFVERLTETGHPFLILTNNSIYTPRDLAARLNRAGIEVTEDHIWTSALATARFLDDQMPGASAYVIGETGLTTALHQAGFVMTDNDPDFVVLGETRTYSFEAITQAIRHIGRGARFIATNPDVTGPSPDGPLPATGSVAALITRATGVEPYYVGKPNPMMLRAALNKIGAHSEVTALVGDRMDTDVVAGIEAGLTTFLVLTGSTSKEEIARFPYRPTMVVDSIADLIEYV
jgi:NagD protein